MKILFVAGEPSGDEHGSHLVKSLLKRLPDIDAYGIGGPLMEEEGLRLIHNITELSVIGLIEVAKSYPRLKKVFDDMLKHVDDDKPDAVIFIDYPGFNLRLAKKIKKAHPEIPVIYFVSPQLWAWGHRRIHTVRKIVDLMLVFFPFEVDVYNKGGKWVVHDNETISIATHKFHTKSNLTVKHVGHPLISKLESFVPDTNFLKDNNIPDNKRIIAILPGSRENEIKKILPVLLESALKLKKEIPNLFFILSCARPGLKELINIEIESSGIQLPCDFLRTVDNSMYDIVHNSEIALVTSGTAAFEAAISLKPVLVLYRMNFISFSVARALFKLPFINLANIIAGKRIVPEFIQHQMTSDRIVPAAKKYLSDNDYYDKTVEELKSVREDLCHGDAGENAAEEICEFIHNN